MGASVPCLGHFLFELLPRAVNGNWRDNRRENLRYMCPNCHATTETWCRRKGGGVLAG
ncbi:hypothetical protein RKD18_003436 [Streptomyces phaeoluteigriseus]